MGWNRVLAVLVSLFAGEVQADSTPWSKTKNVAPGAARSIGKYAAGCVQGAVPLPERGPGYQHIRRLRNRYFGHPTLIGFIQAFGKAVDSAKVGPILVVDLGQPRGGPLPNAHASHQNGLDVDILFWHPPAAKTRRLSKQEQQQSAPRVVDPSTGSLTEFWSSDIREQLAIAARLPGVAKILVNPHIKRHLCKTSTGRREYLRKLRPWYGHADHMHVRMECPKDSPTCVPLPPIAPGDGCDELDWWFDAKAQAERKKRRKKYQKSVGATPPMPKECKRLLGQ